MLMQQSSLIKSVFLYSLPIVLSALAFACYYTPDRDILHDKDVFVFPYDDSSSGGNSSIQYQFDSNGGLSYTYTLRNSIKFPYAGIMILKRDSSFLDFSRYNSLAVKVTDSTRKNIVPVYLFTNISAYSTWDSVVTFVNAQSFIQVEDIGQTAYLAFESFFIPTWWYDFQKAEQQVNFVPDFGNVAVINFAAQASSLMNTEYTVHLETVAVTKRMRLFYAVIAIISALYYTVLVALRYAGRFFKSTERNSINKLVTFSYEKVAALEEQDLPAEVFEYINKHYWMPDLSIADVLRETGLSERKLSQIIKEKTDLTFKQYLNNIRLSEAKRMLKDTDLRVSEIAYKIGYNNVTHFNRVFKLDENVSPSYYRMQATGDI